MSESAAFEPGVYVKGGLTRRVETRADAVAAVFEGFVLQKDDEPQEQSPALVSVPDPDEHDDETDFGRLPDDEDEDAANGVDTSESSRVYTF